MAIGAVQFPTRIETRQERMSDPSTAPAAAKPDAAKVAALLNQAAKAFEAGRTDRLQALLEQILDIDPDNAKALYNLAIVCRDKGDVFPAEVHLRRALKVDPDMIDGYQALADLLFAAKHLMGAAKIYEEALERAPNRLPLLHNLAKSRMMLKEAPATEALARRILSIDDRSSEALADLAWALLFRNGDAQEALDAAEKALRLLPDSPQAQVLKEQALQRLGRSEEAQAIWNKLLANGAKDWKQAKPASECYYWLNLPDRSRALTTAFIDANPDKVDGLRDMSALLMGDGDFIGAQEVLDRAASLGPDNLVLRMLRGLNAFRLGRYQEGLRLYDARWHRDGFDKPWNVPVPEWDGKPIDGRLLVYCEQGIGDYVMYALLFPELRRFAKSIVIEVNSRIASLFRRSFPDMRVIDRNGLPSDWDPASCAAKVAMGDIPLLINSDIEDLPNREGFLIPEPALALKLRKRYQALFPGKRLVGISWRSGNRDSATIRSIDLALWRPIFETPDCAFISLQYGDIKRDIDALRAETGHIVHWDGEIDPMQFLDPFAAQIAAMDLVISVDNSTVHFAGAIGKPCWVLLPVNSDWRWLTERPSSVWYDSLVLFRQQQNLGWEPIVDEVARRLRATGPETLADATGEMCLRCAENLLRRGVMPQAEDYFRWLLETGRHKAAAFHGIGLAAQKAQHSQDAAVLLGQAAELEPDRIDYKADWSVALFEAGHRDAAERLARDLTRQSNDPAALMAMGQIMAAKGLPDQATDYFARILRTDPSHVIARFVLAGLQAAQGEIDLAQRNLTRLIQVAPDLAGPRAALAEIDLRAGREEAGWSNFGWRFGAAPEELPRHLAMMAPADRPKSWSGGKVRKRRLFLRAERTAMEQLLFASLLQEVRKESRAILAECDPASLPILSAAFPDISFAVAGTLTPARLIDERIQLASSLGDLASVYPGASGGWLPYDREAAARVGASLLAGRAAKRVIGLSWRPTSSPLGGLEPLASLLESAGILWVALPAGPVTPALAQLLSSHGGNLVFDPRMTQEGLSALADRIAALDLLVSTEDLAATLAGALGRPVWKIASLTDHWSWLADGNASKWHPGARIFRDSAGADAISGLRAELERFTGGSA
jgi:tetratricopeptide (TPR) repeat protein